MRKEEVLAKIKSEGLDEREQSVLLSSFGYGNIVTMFMCFIFSIINGIKGQGYSEFITIAFATLSATSFYQYKELDKKKTFLISAITSGVTAIMFFILFSIKG